MRPKTLKILGKPFRLDYLTDQLDADLNGECDCDKQLIRIRAWFSPKYDSRPEPERYRAGKASNNDHALGAGNQRIKRKQKSSSSGRVFDQDRRRCP